MIETCHSFMHIDGETHIKVSGKRHGYIHCKCGRWHVVKSFQGKRCSLESYDTFQEAVLLLQKVNQLISKGIFEEWYNDYKIILRKKHNLQLTEAKRRISKK